ncbi:hypothetical protein FQA39_LY03699 [Lamprigera yunnana]|nr:hypothetical protein FQA39_LY03699 [Lamprigera yunnana]
MNVHLVTLFLLLDPLFGFAKVLKEPKISNGYDVVNYDYPYIASYQLDKEHFCGCTLISQYWVLTAAHCIDRALTVAKYRISILAGILRLSDAAYGQMRTIQQQIKHPWYTKSAFKHDIGLVQVTSAFIPAVNVKWAILNYQSLYCNQLGIAGWGYKRSTNPQTNNQLQVAPVVWKSPYECNQKTIIHGVTVTDEMICVVGQIGNETTCGGDSGGPLLCQATDTTILPIGVISWSLQPCGLQRDPSVSTDIFPYLDWIRLIVYPNVYIWGEYKIN